MGETVKGWLGVPGSTALVFSCVHGYALMERPDSKNRWLGHPFLNSWPLRSHCCILLSHFSPLWERNVENKAVE